MPIVENIRAIKAALRQEAQEARAVELKLEALYSDIQAQQAVGAPLTAQQLVARRDALGVAALQAARTAANTAWTATEEIPDQDLLG